MAQDIIISNNQWSGVPFVDFDKVGGGTATYFDSRTVTYNLSGGASVSANPSNAIAGQGFSLKLKAPAGYNLNGVTVTMGGVDITSQVFTPDEEGGGGGTSRTVIAPEQTVTVEGYFTAITSTEGLVDGDAYVYTIDGTEIVGTAIPNGTMLYLNSGTTYAIGDNNGYLYLVTQVTGQHTIKVEKLDLDGGGGGGGSATLISKSITANGTYDAGDDNADRYSDLTVSVPNTYASGDEGKVVSNGALVAQGSDTVTTNGTVDTTLISSLLVNVPSTSAVKSGTITPASATKSMSFNSELSSIKGIIILPTATPLISTRTQVGLICMPTGAYYKSMSLYTNSAGTSLALSGSTSNTRFTISGTTVTVTGQYNFQPTVGYIWYAW